MSKKSILAAIAFIVATIPLPAANDLTFTTLTVADGLNSGRVFSVSQDNDGFMWFGTDNGVCRYDGRAFRSYHCDNMGITGLSDPYVNCIFNLSDGRLLLGTRKGVNVYRQMQDRFELLGMSASIDAEEVRTLYEWGESLYVGTNAGLFVYDLASEKVSRSFSSGDSGLAHDIVRCIYCDGKYLFVGTFDGFCRYDLATEEWVSVDLKSRTSTLRNNLVLSILPSPFDGEKLLVGTQTGLCEVDRNTLEFKIYDAANSPMNNITIKTMCVYGNEVWMGTENGLVIWDGSSFRNCTYNPQNFRSLINNVVWNIYRDSRDGMWIATDSGVCYYDTDIPDFEKVSLLDARNNPNVGIDILDAVVDRSGNVWLASRSVFAKYSPQTNSMIWRPALAGQSGLYNSVHSLHIDGRGIIWLGTDEGLGCYDTVRERYEFIQSRLKYKLKYIVSVTSDVDGRLYAAASNGQTQILTYEVDPVSGRVEVISEQSLSVNDQITSMVVSGNDLWYGTSINGVIRKDFATGQMKRYYSQPDESDNGGMNLVKCLCVGRVSGNLYVGTGNGVYALDEAQDSFVPIDPVSEDTEILTMEEDGSGFLWYTMPRSIACFDAKDGLSRRFSLNAWFDRRHNVISASCAKDDDVYLLGTDGYLKVNFKDIHKDVEPYSLVISEMKINDIPVEYTDIVDVPLTRLKKLNLKYDQNTISFSFAMLDYSDPLSVIYGLRLSGFDEWKVCTGLQNSVVYSMIPSGKYRLQVSALSGSGAYSGNVIDMDITIASPPWLRWWAVLGYVLGSLGILAAVIYYLDRRRKVREALARAKMEKENAENLSNLKLQLFTNISHDFKTPLSLIISPVETLIETEADEGRLNYLNIIRTNSKRLLALVNQILDFRRAESDKLEIELSSGDIVSALRGIVESFADIASKKNISIEFDSSEESLVCDFDGGGIDKIFVNLISNAVKFTRENGQVVVSFRRKSDAEMEIMVADSGVGIAEEDLPHIFEKFYSVDNYSSLGGGTGLGLMIVKDLVEQHGGRVCVYSRQDVGSTFIVTLPVVNEVREAGESSAEEPAVAQDGRPAGSVPDGGGKGRVYSVLIVEDDGSMRDYLVSELGKYYEVSAFTNAEDALAAMERLAPDLVVSDLMLGKDRMTGTDFCRTLRSSDRWKTLPVILLTAVTSEESVMEGFDAGANEYIGKPFNVRVLCTRIDNLLSQLRTVRETVSHNVLPAPEAEIQSPDDVFLAKLTEVIEAHISEPDLNIPFLCDQMAMSHVSFYRKVKALTGQNVNSLVRDLRMKKAARMLQVKGISVTDAMYAVGFSHRSYFTVCFKETFGMTPKMYARQYNNPDADPDDKA